MDYRRPTGNEKRFVITMLAILLSPEITNIDDVGAKDDLGTVFGTFKLYQNFYTNFIFGIKAQENVFLALFIFVLLNLKSTADENSFIAI